MSERQARMLRQRMRVLATEGLKQNLNGTYSLVEPMDRVEEHNWAQRLIFWLRRVEHCNDREGQRKP